MRLLFFVVLLLLLGSTSPISAQPTSKQAGAAPSQRLVKGIIIDATTGQGLEFATISITTKKDGSVSGGGLSEADGSFQFKVDGTELAAIIEFISYETTTIDPLPMDKPIIDLGKIELHPSSVELEDVEIVAERSETTFSLDKKVFTVGKDLANRGGTAEDVLNNVPSLDVDIEGTVTLRGSTGVRILIDGRPSSLVGVDSGSGLRSLASNLIERIEVITNPSARYDAEGMAGIINIVLKKNRADGFNGSIDLTAGLPTTGGVSANLNYRKGPLNWFVNYGLNYRSNLGLGHTIQDRISQGIGTDEFYRQLSTIDRDPLRAGLDNSFRFGADYFINDKTQITAAFQYKIGDDENETTLLYRDYSEQFGEIGIGALWTDQTQNFQDFDTFDAMLNTPSLIGTTTRIDDELEDESALQYSLNFTKEYSSRDHKLSASINYQDRGESENSIFTENFVDNQGGDDFLLDQRVENDEISKTWEVQVDYVKPISKDQKWEVGAKSSFRDINTNYLVEESDANGNFFALPGLNNSFDYDEDVIAAYGIYGNKRDNFSYQVGLRGEYSIINTFLVSNEGNPPNRRTYFNFFPSGHISYHLNDTDALQISYSRRINRPRFWDLNPFFTFQDRRNFFSGNPNMDPEYTDSYEIGQIKYWEGVTLSSSLFYRRTEDSRQRFLSVDRVTQNTVRIPLNIGTTDDYGLDLSIGYSGLSWLKVDFNTNIFRNQLSFDEDNVEDEVLRYYTDLRDFEGDENDLAERFAYNFQETDNITWNAKMTTRFSFLDSDLQLRMNYRGARQNVQGESAAVGSLDVGWSRDFLPGKNLTATLSIRDIFNSRRRAGQTFLDNFYQQQEFQWRSRVGTLTLSYRINQKKKRGGGNRGGGGQGGGEF